MANVEATGGRTLDESFDVEMASMPSLRSGPNKSYVGVSLTDPTKSEEKFDPEMGTENNIFPKPRPSDSRVQVIDVDLENGAKSPSSNGELEVEGGVDPAMKDKLNEITWSHVNFRIGEKTILKDCWGEVRPGQVCAVMGPSGAGKSSLLNVLAGRTSSDKGSHLEVEGHVQQLFDLCLFFGFHHFLSSFRSESVVCK
jgi:ABC-type multidrug transport system fused ATPase/permease subunit